MDADYVRAIIGSSPPDAHTSADHVSGRCEDGDDNLIAVTTSGPSLASLYKRGQERQLIPAISSGSDYN